jgi:hypothetical protein
MHGVIRTSYSVLFRGSEVKKRLQRGIEIYLKGIRREDVCEDACFWLRIVANTGLSRIQNEPERVSFSRALRCVVGCFLADHDRST